MPKLPSHIMERFSRERLDEGKLLQSEAGAFELKQNGAAHTVEAVVATLGVADKQGDVLVAGSVGKQSVLMSPFNHSSVSLMFNPGQELPAGKGFVEERGDELVFIGEFFDTAIGNDTFEVLSKTQDTVEWSFGFKALDFRFGEQDDEPVVFIEQMDVFEASPVMRGAGRNTRTLSVKSGLRFAAEVEAVGLGVSHIVERAVGLRDARLAAGKARALTDDRAAELNKLAAQLAKAGADLQTLTEPAPDPAEKDAALQSAALEQLFKSNERNVKINGQRIN